MGGLRLYSPWVLFNLIVVALALAVGIAAAETGARAERGAEIGFEMLHLEVDGHDRTAYLFEPEGESVDAGLRPLVVVLHGGGRGDGKTVADAGRLHEVAGADGALVVYPNGIDAVWNDGRGASYRRGEAVTEADDVAFLSVLIDHLIATRRADPARVYLTGASNGGMMTHRAGCALAGKLAAIAPVIGNMPRPVAPQCAPAVPLPVLLIVGEADPWMPYRGGSVTVLRRPVGAVLSAEETIGLWARVNGCSGSPEVSYLPNAAPDDGTRVRRSLYTGCRAATELLTIEGGGHAWPGGARGQRLERLIGKVSEDLDASEAIWDFFKDKRRD